MYLVNNDNYSKQNFRSLIIKPEAIADIENAGPKLAAELKVMGQGLKDTVNHLVIGKDLRPTLTDENNIIAYTTPIIFHKPSAASKNLEFHATWAGSKNITSGLQWNQLMFDSPERAIVEYERIKTLKPIEQFAEVLRYDDAQIKKAATEARLNRDDGNISETLSEFVK